MQVSPVSAGYCIGSSNWIIASESSGVRIGYVSGSSTLATHPKPFDKVRRYHADIFVCYFIFLTCNPLSFNEIAQTALKGVDCLLLTSLTMTPLHNPNPMIGEFCQTVCDTIRQGGNVLVPCYPSGKKINFNFNPTFYKKCRVASTRARKKRSARGVSVQV